MILNMWNTCTKTLIKYETIDSNQIKDIMDDKEPRPPEDWNSNDDSPDNTTPSSDIGGPATEH